jgi:hypothetical protein
MFEIGIGAPMKISRGILKLAQKADTFASRGVAI